MESNMYQWPLDITQYRTSRTDAIATELHRLGCNVCSKLRDERTPYREPGGGGAMGGSCAYPFTPGATPTSLSAQSTPSTLGFGPALAPPPPAQAPLAPLAPYPQAQPFGLAGGPADAQSMQADMVSFYRLPPPPPSPSPHPHSHPVSPLMAPPPPPTPRSPLPPAGVLHCPTPQFAFSPPAPPFEFQAPPPTQQQQHNHHHHHHHKDQQYIQYSQFTTPCDVCSEQLRKRRSTAARVDQRGDTSRRSNTKMANEDLLPGHVIWPEVGVLHAMEVREKVRQKGSTRCLVIPASAAEARRCDVAPTSYPLRKSTHAVVTETLYDQETDSESSEFFWDSPDEGISRRARAKAKGMVAVENKIKHMHVVAGSRRCAHRPMTHRRRELRPRAEDGSRGTRRNAAGDKRRHVGADPLDRHVKLRRAEYDPLYHSQQRQRRLQRSWAAEEVRGMRTKSVANAAELQRGVLKERVDKPAAGNAKRERPDMGDTPRHLRRPQEGEKLVQQQEGGGVRRTQTPSGAGERVLKQRGKEDYSQVYQQQSETGTVIELVEGSEMQYIEQAQETEIQQIQQAEIWFNNLPTIAEMQHDEESPGNSRHVYRLAATDSKKRVKVLNGNLQKKHADVMEMSQAPLTKISAREQEEKLLSHQTLNPPEPFLSGDQQPPSPYQWRAEVYTARIKTIDKSEKASEIEKKIQDKKTWPQPLPTLLVSHKDKAPQAFKIEKEPKHCVKVVRNAQQPQTKDVERITIISIQHDQENNLKSTKHLLQAAKDEIQALHQSSGVDARIVDQQTKERERRMISVSTQRGRSQCSESIPGKNSRAIGTHSERSRSGVRLRRVQITPIVRFRRINHVSLTSLQNITNMSDSNCKSNSNSTEGASQTIKEPHLDSTELVSKSMNDSSSRSSYPSAVVESNALSDATRQTTNTSSGHKLENIEPILQSESRTSNKLLSVNSKTISGLSRKSTTNTQSPAMTENKHSKAKRKTIDTASITGSRTGIKITSQVESQALEISQPIDQSLNGMLRINCHSLFSKDNNNKLSDASWHTINVHSMTESQKLNTHSQDGSQTNKPGPVGTQTFHNTPFYGESVNKRQSTGTECNKKLSDASWQTIIKYLETDHQTISNTSQTGLRASHMSSSSSSHKMDFHGLKSSKNKSPDVFQDNNHSESQIQIIKKSSAPDLQNISKLPEVDSKYTIPSQIAEKHLKETSSQPEKNPKEIGIQNICLVSAIENKCEYGNQKNNVLHDEISKHAMTRNMEIVENKDQQQQHTGGNVMNVSQVKEAGRQNFQCLPESKIRNVQQAPTDHVQRDLTSPRRVRISLPPANSLKSILKPHAQGSGNERKRSGGAHGTRRSSQGSPKAPPVCLWHSHNRVVTRSKDDEKLNYQKLSRTEKLRQSKHSESKHKDTTRITIHIKKPSRGSNKKETQNQPAGVKEGNHSERDVPSHDDISLMAEWKSDQETLIASDFRQEPTLVNMLENNELAGHENSTRGFAESTVHSVSLSNSSEKSKDSTNATQYCTKSTQLGEENSHTNSQTESLQKLVKELTVVAKDLHRTVVNDLRRLENAPSHSTESQKPETVDSNKHFQDLNDTIVEKIEAKQEKEVKCIFMSGESGKTNIQYPNTLNCVQPINEPPKGNIHPTKKELSNEYQIHCKFQSGESKRDHSVLKSNTEYFQRAGDAETARIKQCAAGNMTNNKELPGVEKKIKTKNTFCSKSPRIIEETIQKNLPGSSQNHDQSGAGLKWTHKSERKDIENVRKSHAVTMRHVQKSTASLTRRFQRRPTMNAHYQHHNRKEEKTLQKVKHLKEKKDARSRVTERNTSNSLEREESEINNVFLHSETKLKSNQDPNHPMPLDQGTVTMEAQGKKGLLPSWQDGRQFEETAKYFPQSPSRHFQQLLGENKETGRHSSPSSLEDKRFLRRNSQSIIQPPKSIIQNHKQSWFQREQQIHEVTQPPTGIVLNTKGISHHESQKRSTDLFCIKRPPKPASKIERSSSVFNKRRLQNIVGNGINKTRKQTPARSKPTSNILKITTDKDQKHLIRGIRNLKQHPPIIPEDRERKQGANTALAPRQQNSTQNPHQPKTTEIFSSRQQADTNSKNDKDLTNVTSQKVQKPPSAQQPLKDKFDCGLHRPTSRTQQSTKTPGISRQLLKRRGIVKKRRITKPAVTTRRIKQSSITINRCYKLNPVELAEMAELDPRIILPNEPNTPPQPACFRWRDAEFPDAANYGNSTREEPFLYDKGL